MPKKLHKEEIRKKIMKAALQCKEWTRVSEFAFEHGFNSSTAKAVIYSLREQGLVETRLEGRQLYFRATEKAEKEDKVEEVEERMREVRKMKAEEKLREAAKLWAARRNPFVLIRGLKDEEFEEFKRELEFFRGLLAVRKKDVRSILSKTTEELIKKYPNRYPTKNGILWFTFKLINSVSMTKTALDMAFRFGNISEEIKEYAESQLKRTKMTLEEVGRKFDVETAEIEKALRSFAVSPTGTAARDVNDATVKVIEQIFKQIFAEVF